MRLNDGLKLSLACVFVGAIALSGCGGGSSNSSSSSGVALAASGSAAPATTAAASSGGSVSSSNFCALAKEYTSFFSELAGPMTVTHYNSFIKINKEFENAALSQVPSSIKSDVEIVYAQINSAYAQLPNYNYDLTKLPPGTLEGTNNPQFAQAEAALQAYSKAHPSTDPSDPAKGKCPGL